MSSSVCACPTRAVSGPISPHLLAPSDKLRFRSRWRYSACMRNRAVMLAMMLGLGCGGQSERDGTSGVPGPGTTDGGGSSPVGSDTAASAQAGKSYVPEASNLSAAGDGRLDGGSFEGNLGDGWDFCPSKHPGATLMEGSDRSSDGDAWLAFDSRKSCSASSACRAEGSDTQVGFWLGTPLPAGVPLHLYFDAINLGQETPSGTLHVHVVDVMQTGCMSAGALATIPLGDLELTSDWSTRCVSFTPNVPLDVLGLYVTGSAFQLGLDALRFGPPCGN